MKILLVDDSAFMRKILKNILNTLNYRDIIEAADGKSAVSKFEKDKPDLVLLDIILPDIGGIEILREIKKIDPNAKVIMITAVGQEAMIDECKRVGISAYIIKPFSNEKISEAIKEAKK